MIFKHLRIGDAFFVSKNPEINIMIVTDKIGR